jgi:hypothetical protein
MYQPKSYLGSAFLVALGPIFYHVSADLTVSFTCYLLLEFVDTYSTFIIVLFFLTGSLLKKNQLLAITFKEVNGVKKFRFSSPREVFVFIKKYISSKFKK